MCRNAKSSSLDQHPHNFLNVVLNIGTQKLTLVDFYTSNLFCFVKVRGPK